MQTILFLRLEIVQIDTQIHFTHCYVANASSSIFNFIYMLSV